jgi:ParB-like nuclease domain
LIGSQRRVYIQPVLHWADDNLRELDCHEIGEHYGCYRLHLPEAERAMARSLERYGQLSPVVVCRRQQRYELIDGFKRLSAARTLAHLSHLSARLLEADERTAKAAIYGLNRAGGRTRELEEAWIIQALVREDGMSQVEVAELLGRHKSWVCRRLALIERLGPPHATNYASVCCRPPRRGRSCGCRRATRRRSWRPSDAKRYRVPSWPAWSISGWAAPNGASKNTSCDIRAKHCRKPTESSRRSTIPG